MSALHFGGTAVPEDLNPSGYKTVVDLFGHACNHFANRPAFTCLGHSISYRQLDRQSAAFACYLQQETDLQPGDRIAIQLPNILQYPVAIFGALRAGLVIVNTNPLYTAREMLHQFKDSGAKALVIFQGAAGQLKEIVDDTDLKYLFVTRLGDMHPGPKRRMINFVARYIKKVESSISLPNQVSFVSAIKSRLGQSPLAVESDSRNPVILQYTGGTTGVSKGAMLTNANLISNMLQCLHRITDAGDGWGQHCIAPLPLYHIFAFTVSLTVLEQGGHSILIPNPRDIPGFVKVLRRCRPTSFIGLNTLFVALCRQPKFKRVDFSRLILTVSGGMALTHAAAERWQAVTGCAIVEGYGLTETSPVVSINPPGREQVGTVGLPVAHTEIRIVDERGDAVREGEAGELCVRGPQVMAGYWHQPLATRACFSDDGFFKTGDIAQRQPDGYLKIVDRAKDMINVSGFNVYPNEIEDVVSTHPDIIECAAVGDTGPSGGEIVKLYVVTDNDKLTEEMVRDWCKKHLTAYKVPQRVEFIDELPKSNVGKVLRRCLRESSTGDAL